MFVFLCSITAGLNAQRIKLYTFYTPSHEALFRNWFLPSISELDEYDLIVDVYNQECKSAEFMSEGWTKTTRRKISLIQRAIRENWGSWFVYSDVDIQFFQLTMAEIKQALVGQDMVFQQDDHKKNLCTGFFACRANKITQRFWDAVAHHMDTYAQWSDQITVATLLEKRRTHKVRFDILPNTFFGGGSLTGSIWNPGDALEIPHDIIMHHANYAIGVEHKIEQLKLVRSMVEQKCVMNALPNP
jgi:hypothetical protein